MSKLGINTGSTPNDGTGDNLLSESYKDKFNFDGAFVYLEMVLLTPQSLVLVLELMFL